MIIFGVIVVIVGCIQFWLRDRWVRQAIVITGSFGLKSWSAKPVRRFWARWEVAGNIFFWIAGTVFIVMALSRC